jgi:hypothetical protein
MSSTVEIKIEGTESDYYYPTPEHEDYNIPLSIQPTSYIFVAAKSQYFPRLGRIPCKYGSGTQ